MKKISHIARYVCGSRLLTGDYHAQSAKRKPRVSNSDAVTERQGKRIISELFNLYAILKYLFNALPLFCQDNRDNAKLTL